MYMFFCFVIFYFFIFGFFYMYMYLSMYLVVGLCKLGTTFYINFEQQRCKISVYTAGRNGFHFKLEKKSVDFAWACLNDPRFTDHLLFKTGFHCTN